MKTPRERIELISEVSEALYAATSTFEGQVGLDLAYLYPAIAKGTVVEWGAPFQTETINLFRELFPAEHAVWNSIVVMAEPKVDEKPQG